MRLLNYLGGLGVRIVFQDGVIARGYARGIFYRSPQFKANAQFALSAKWEPIAHQQRGLMHQAMRIVRNTIDAVFRHHLSWPVLFSDCLPLLGQYLPSAAEIILKDFQDC